MVEIEIVDDAGAVILSLMWRKRSKQVCYRFSDTKIAKASFKVLARALGVEEDSWRTLGI